MTRVYSREFGSDASISVVSNVAAGTQSSGFGTSAVTDSGVDIIATIGSGTFTGDGNVVTATSGSEKGLSLQIGADASNATATVTGAQGTISVTDNSLQFQIGANQNQTAQITIDKVNPNALGFGVSGNQFSYLNEIDITSAGKAQDALGVIDSAIDDVSSLRGTLGAFQQNTLESTANNLRTTLENTVNAESTIRDTDFAEEIANFTRNQVLVQSSTAALGNANQIPQLVLSLL